MPQLLKEAGPRGSTLGELVNGVQQAGLKTWTDMRIAKSSIASTCGHDLAFGRLPHGRFALRGLPGVRQARLRPQMQCNFEIHRNMPLPLHKPILIMVVSELPSALMSISIPCSLALAVLLCHQDVLRKHLNFRASSQPSCTCCCDPQMRLLQVVMSKLPAVFAMRQCKVAAAPVSNLHTCK